MNDVLSADRNQGQPLCFLDLADANQVILSQDSYFMVILYCWCNFESKESNDKYLAMQFNLN